MSKIKEAQDALTAARNCIDCIWLAAAGLNENTGPIQYVAGIATDKIDEALELLKEYRSAPQIAA
jgi:hypothetical protein